VIASSYLMNMLEERQATIDTLREVVGELVNAMEKQHVVCKERLVGWDFSDLIAKAKGLLNG
jgi:hypothetical protein